MAAANEKVARRGGPTLVNTMRSGKILLYIFFSFFEPCVCIGGAVRCTELRVQAEQQCNVNVSFRMAELLSSTVLTLLDDVAGKVQAAEAEPFLPYSVSNQTGVVVRYGRKGSDAPLSMLVPGEEQALDLWAETERHVLCSADGRWPEGARSGAPDTGRRRRPLYAGASKEL